MNEFAVARALHVLAIVLWIGGVAFVTAVLLPAVRRQVPAPQRLALFDRIERLVLVGPATRNFDVAPVPAHTLVVHGETDDVVPLSATLDWARPQGLPVVVVPGVGHFFHGQLPLLKNLVARALL